MNVDLTNQVYEDLKLYLQENSQYNPFVVKKALKQTDKFPLVTFIEENNVFSYGTLKFKQREIIDNIFWEINIYSDDKIINNTTVSNALICDEIKVLIDNIMTNKYGFRRISCRPTPNLEDTIYRITMRYSGKILVNKNRII